MSMPAAAAAGSVWIAHRGPPAPHSVCSCCRWWWQHGLVTMCCIVCTQPKQQTSTSTSTQQPTHPPTPHPPSRHSIVLENSGVAEPGNIRDQFAEAAASGHPLLERIELDTLVTLVDASSFMADYAAR